MAKAKQTKAQPTRGKRRSPKPKAPDPLGGWRKTPEVANDDKQETFGTSFDGQADFLLYVRGVLLGYAGRLRASHGETDRALAVGSSVRRTHGLLVKTAASLEKRTQQVLADGKNFDDWVNLMNM